MFSAADPSACELLKISPPEALHTKINASPNDELEILKQKLLLANAANERLETELSVALRRSGALNQN